MLRNEIDKDFLGELEKRRDSAQLTEEMRDVCRRRGVAERKEEILLELAVQCREEVLESATRDLLGCSSTGEAARGG